MAGPVQNLTALADDIVAEVNQQGFMAANQATTAFAPIEDLKVLVAGAAPIIHFVPNVGTEARRGASITFDGDYTVVCEVYQYVGLPASSYDTMVRALLLLTDQIADFLKGAGGVLVFTVAGLKQFKAVLEDINGSYDHMLLNQKGIFIHQAELKFKVIV